MATATLLISCPDRPGLVHAVAEFVLAVNGSVVHAEQHVDTEAGVFFQRVEFDLDGATIGRDELASAFEPVAAKFDMNVRVRFSDERPRIAILASKQPHCLADLLGRWRSGELPAEVVTVVSNHPDHAELAAFHGVKYHYIPIDPEGRAARYAEMAALLHDYDVDLIVLARYMQVLNSAFLDEFPNQIINIHHSFLPAFAGARPYHQAQERGVKLIGATAHYATAELDEGPIIAQEVTAVSHRDRVEDLIRKGRDLETVTLARAVRAHVEHRTLVFGNKTIVFG
jgi:formyltetrahydrofolate deformylase